MHSITSKAKQNITEIFMFHSLRFDLIVNKMLFSRFSHFQLKMVARGFSCTPAASMKQWRVERGLPVNKNAEGVLTDGPDYTFLDGRPTPLLHKQKLRMEKQQVYASKIVDYCTELDFAKKRHQDALRAQEEKREQYIRNRLKPKGSALAEK